jgi:hypothetical protein
MIPLKTGCGRSHITRIGVYYIRRIDTPTHTLSVKYTYTLTRDCWGVGDGCPHLQQQLQGILFYLVHLDFSRLIENNRKAYRARIFK